MLINLISNCPHNSSRHNFIIKKNKKFFFCKSSTRKKEIEILKREIEGISFFNQYSKNKIEYQKKFINNYGKIEIKKIDGNIVNPKKGFNNNIQYMDLVFDKYIELYHSSSINFSHGDLSFSNIIFSEKNCFIIDWEHFSLNKLPIGFDLMYFIFENIFFEKKFKYTKNNYFIKYVIEKIKYLKEIKLLSDIFKKGNILKNIILILLKEKKIWNYEIKNLKNKFPVLQFDKKYIEEIDNLINERI